MEAPNKFWGAEVEARQSVKVDPKKTEEDGFIKISQVALGEVKKDEKSESVVLYLKVDDHKSVLGTLSRDDSPQLSLDLFLHKEFELSHSSTTASVYFAGCKFRCKDPAGNITILDIKSFKNAKTLVSKGKALRSHSRDGLEGCIEKLSEGISIMEHLPLSKFDLNYLCEAYCLRALCEQEYKPESEQIFKDIKAALCLWRHFPLPPDMTILFYNIIDLMQLKGFMQLSNRAHSLLINKFKDERVSMNKWLTLLWETRRLSHSCCISPMDEAFVKESTDITMLAQCLKGNPSVLTMFLQSFSMLFLSCKENSSSYHGLDFPTADKIRNIADEHGMNHQSHFVSAYMYLELSKQQVANGQLIEALKSATKAHGLFVNVIAGPLKNKEVEEKIHELFSKEMEVCLLKHELRDLKDSYLSPWKKIQGLLEGILQLGIALELYGNGFQAQSYFNFGRRISSAFHIPLFMVVFSILLGKMYVRGYPDNVEESMLHYARKIFEANKKSLGCSKCSSLLSFSLYEHFGDLHQTKSATVFADEQYRKAFAELNSDPWKNTISCPGDGNDAIAADIEWRCLPSEVIKSGLLENFIDFKWECIRRQLIMALNTRLVKCGGDDENDKAVNILLRSTNCLVHRNLFYTTSDFISKDFFDHLVAVEVSSDIFVFQRVEIILDVCWYSLKYFCSEFASKLFCDLSSIEAAQIVSWLKVAFVLSREMPLIFQKVSKLLAVLYVVSCSSKQLSLSSNEDDVAENCWAAYFHQASIGRNLTRDFHLYSARRCMSLSDAGPSSIGPDTFESLWLVPKATKDLAKHVKKFLVGIPSATITSICILGLDYTMLQQLPISPCLPEHTRALMLLSRLSFDNEPIVILLPVDSISQDVENLVDMDENARRDTVIDDILPSFRTIVEEGRLYTNLDANRRRREKLDLCLGTLLSKMEENWFGSWKSLLLGECLKTNAFDQWLERFAKNQRPMCKLTECLLKILLGGEGKTLGSKLSSEKPCYIAKIGYDSWCRTMSDATNDFKLKYVPEVIDNVERKPVILVLDDELQMFPWENLPTAREHEMYRMPSVSSIFLMGRDPMSMPIPSIDPSHAFYLLDAENEKIIFKNTEKIFKSQALEGKAHTRPTLQELQQELVSALQTHDLFMYFGHNDGSQYISKKEIHKLQKCAVVLLMGCHSGKFTCRGNYAPNPPAPMSYLLGGSPAVVANLWFAQVSEVDKMAAALFEAWLTERSNVSSDKRRIGAFLPHARKACEHPFLAGLVCYGVPTGICTKNKFQTGQHNERKRSVIDP